MCEQAANGVELQCSREYWKDTPKPRATQINELTEEAERYLARFGYISSVSASRSNRFFKAKRIRDDMMFVPSATDEAMLQQVMCVPGGNPLIRSGDRC